MSFGQKIAIFGLANTGLIASLVLRAVFKHRDFYSAAVFLLRDRTVATLFHSLCFYSLFLLSLLAKNVLLGELRIIEAENLRQSAGELGFDFFVSASMVKKELSFGVVFLLIALALIRISKDLFSERINLMEQREVLPLHFYTRLSLFFLLSGLLVTGMLFSVRQKQNTPFKILFIAECLLLHCDNAKLLVRASLNEFERRTAWEEKSIFLAYLDVFFAVLRLSANLWAAAFFISKGILPLSIFKRCFSEFRTVALGVRNTFRYWTLISRLQRQHPDATQEQLVESPTCPICRFDMDSAKRLPCGHMFHFPCLRTWLERHQTCPTCRRPLLAETQEEHLGELVRRLETESNREAVLQAFNVAQARALSGEPPLEATAEQLLRTEEAASAPEGSVLALLEEARVELRQIEGHLQRELEAIKKKLEAIEQRLAQGA